MASRRSGRGAAPRVARTRILVLLAAGAAAAVALPAAAWSSGTVRDTSRLRFDAAALRDTSPIGGAGAAAPDTSRLRVEVGASTDVANEQFYEETFLADTTFLRRRLVSTPEARYAGVLDVGLKGTRAHRALRYQLHHTLNLGDLLQRGALDFAGSWDFAPGWRLRLAPQAELRHDRTFGRDLTEARGAATARLRRTIRGAETFAELGLGGDFLRVSGRGTDFLLDRDLGLVSLALDHAGLDGGEWRAGWGLAVRALPDSSERNHLEHGWEGRWRGVTSGGHALAVETDGVRRMTLKAAPTMRDVFWEARAALEVELWSLAAWSWRARLEGELLRYDHEDSILFLNTGVLRGRAGPRWQNAAGWSVSPAVRGERLASPRDPGEDYAEAGGELALEWLGLRGWWSLAPAGGWREYLDTSGRPGPLALPGMHSSFAFYEFTLFGDQPLPGRLRLRVAGTGRLEFHADLTQDARSLYFSVDLRRLL